MIAKPNIIVSQDKDKRTRYNLLSAQLKNERTSFEPDWQTCNDYILSRRARFFSSDANRGGRRNQKIIDNTGTLAVRTLRSGMMAGITSPAREWKRLTTQDPDLAEYSSVKRWLSVVNDRMTNIFLRSNLYNVLPLTYGDMGVFGIGGIIMEEDMDTVVRFYSVPIGSYWIANDELLRVRIYMREFRMTVRQIVGKFGRVDYNTQKIDWSNISDFVKTCWERGEYEVWVNVCHIIHPNDEYEPSRIDSKYSGKYRSCYYETGNTGATSHNYLKKGDDFKYLREKGYGYFPGLFPRWEVTGEDVYATSFPGIDAIGDIKQLQHGEKRSAQAVDKKIMPPMTGPTALRTQKASILSGDITYLDTREGQQGFRPTHEVDFSIREHEEKQQQVRLRIQRAFYEDLFLMLAQSDRREITAREIDERHEEKLLALGPVLEQLNQDLLDPLIDNTFDFMLRQGEIPPPPEELMQEGNNNLKVEYVSIMAQAQKLVGISSIERFAGFVTNIAAQTGQPQILRKVNIDQMIDVYGNRLGVDPEIIRSDDDVEAIEAQDQKAQQAMVMAEQIKNAAGAARDLSQADLEKDSALKRLVDQSQAGQLAQGA